MGGQENQGDDMESKLTPERAAMFAAILRQIEASYPKPVTATTICENLNILSSDKLTGATVREAVHYYRSLTSPVPIMSGPDGYSIAHNPEDLDATIKQLRGRALSILTAYSRLKRWRAEAKFILPSPVKMPTTSLVVPATAPALASTTTPEYPVRRRRHNNQLELGMM